MKDNQKQKIESVLVHGLTRADNETIKQFIADCEEFPLWAKLNAARSMARKANMSKEDAHKYLAKIRTRVRAAGILKKMTAWEDLSPQQALDKVLRDARQRTQEARGFGPRNLEGMIAELTRDILAVGLRSLVDSERKQMDGFFQKQGAVEGQEVFKDFFANRFPGQEKWSRVAWGMLDSTTQAHCIRLALRRFLDSEGGPGPRTIEEHKKTQEGLDKEMLEVLEKSMREAWGALNEPEIGGDLPPWVVQDAADIARGLPVPKNPFAPMLPDVSEITPRQLLDTAEIEFKTALALQLPRWAKHWQQLWDRIGNVAQRHLFEIAIAHLTYASEDKKS